MQHFTFGVKKTLGAPDEALKDVPAVALCGGVALYLAGHIAFRYRNVHTFNTQRGIATLACLALIPVAIGVGVIVFAATLALTRWVSLGSILAALSLPVALAVQRAMGAEVAPPLWGFALAVPFFIIWTHRTNVRRLLDGTEPRLSDPARPTVP